MMRSLFRRNSSRRDYLLERISLYVSFAWLPFVFGITVGLLFSIVAINSAADYLDAHYICSERQQ